MAFAPAQAQEYRCEAANAGDIVDQSLFTDLEGDSSQALQFEAGRIEAQLGDRPTTLMSGGVLVRQGNRLAGAETARYDPDTLALSLEGGDRKSTRLNSSH